MYLHIIQYVCTWIICSTRYYIKLKTHISINYYNYCLLEWNVEQLIILSLYIQSLFNHKLYNSHPLVCDCVHYKHIIYLRQSNNWNSIKIMYEKKHLYFLYRSSTYHKSTNLYVQGPFYGYRIYLKLKQYDFNKKNNFKIV